MEIEVIYRTLTKLGLVRSQVEFSRVWLGRSARYYSSMLAGKHRPGLGTLSALLFRLRRVQSTLADPRTEAAIAEVSDRLERYVALRAICNIVT